MVKSHGEEFCSMHAIPISFFFFVFFFHFYSRNTWVYTPHLTGRRRSPTFLFVYIEDLSGDVDGIKANEEPHTC